MDPVFQSFLSGVPVLLLHFSVTVLLLGGGVALYLIVTPYHEVRLIRNGNTAAAVSLSGAVLGLGLPLAFCMARSVNVLDIVIWGAVTLLLQLVAYRVADLVLRDLPGRIENDEIGPAILLVAIKLAISFINAAAVAG